MTQRALTPAEFQSALDRGDVFEPGASISAAYQAHLVRLIAALAAACTRDARAAATWYTAAADQDDASMFAQLIADRTRHARDLTRLLEPLGADSRLPFDIASATRDAGPARNLWCPTIDVVTATSCDDFFGAWTVLGLFADLHVAELTTSSWGPLRREAATIVRENLVHRSRSARAMTSVSGGPAAAQALLDRWFGISIEWVQSTDVEFQTACAQLALRNAQPRRPVHTEFEQRIRAVAEAAGLAAPAWITAQSPSEGAGSHA